MIPLKLLWIITLPYLSVYLSIYLFIYIYLSVCLLITLHFWMLSIADLDISIMYIISWEPEGHYQYIKDVSIANQKGTIAVQCLVSQWNYLWVSDSLPCLALIWSLHVGLIDLVCLMTIYVDRSVKLNRPLCQSLYISTHILSVMTDVYRKYYNRYKYTPVHTLQDMAPGSQCTRTQLN